MAPRFDPETADWAGLVKTEKAAWSPYQSLHSGRSYTSDLRGMTATEKANLVISDFTNAGALPPKAADQFIVGAVLQSVLLSMVHSDTYDTPSFNVPNTQFAVNFSYNYQGKTGATTVNVDPFAVSNSLAATRSRNAN